MKTLIARIHQQPLLWSSGAFLVFLLGFWLAIVRPGFIADEEYQSAVKGLQAQTAALQKVEVAYQAMEPWYKPKYMSDAQQTLEQLRTSVGNITTDITEAEGMGADDKYEHAHAAKQKLASVAGNIKTLQSELDHLDQSTATIRTRFNEVQRLVPKAHDSYVAVHERFNADHTRYLAKYMDPLDTKLTDTTQSFLRIDRMYPAIWAALPPAEDTTRTGDPDAALVALNIVDQIFFGIKENIRQAANELDLQQLAEQKAQPTTLEARGRIDGVESALLTTEQKHGLTPDKALRQAYGAFHSATQHVAEAERALKAGDNPEAYKMSQNALQQFERSIQIAQEQVNLKQKTLAALEILKQDVSEAKSLLATASDNLSVLRNDHATSAWSDVRNVHESVTDLVANARNAIKEAEVLTHISVQEYQEATVLLNEYSSLLSTTQSSANEVHAKRLTLETAKSAWPSKRRRAANAIEEARSTVHSYGDYSSSAESDFADAESLFREANRAGNRRDFVAAIEYADRAYNQANDADNEASDAYQRHLLAEAAAEAALELLNEGLSSDYGDYGGSGYGVSSGSDSYGFGGSSGSDSSGYGGSSASDGGGW